MNDELQIVEGPPAISWRGQIIDLWPTHVNILIALMKHEVASSMALREEIGRNVTTGALRVHIAKLRAALPPGINVIAVYGKGYRLSVPKSYDVTSSKPVK